MEVPLPYDVLNRLLVDPPSDQSVKVFRFRDESFSVVKNLRTSALGIPIKKTFFRKTAQGTGTDAFCFSRIDPHTHAQVGVGGVGPRGLSSFSIGSGTVPPTIFSCFGGKTTNEESDSEESAAEGYSSEPLGAKKRKLK